MSDHDGIYQALLDALVFLSLTPESAMDDDAVVRCLESMCASIEDSDEPSKQAFTRFVRQRIGEMQVDPVYQATADAYQQVLDGILND